MKQVKVQIGDKSYFCDVFKTEEEHRKGLQGIEHLPPDKGALFVWDTEGTREMWMKNTKIPLDQIGINEDEEVTFVYTAKPEDETLVPFPNVKYVLEVNAESGIKEGDEIEIDDSEDLSKYTMKVLAPDGSTQMFLQGGERIFSRHSTKQLIKWSKKAESVKKDKDKFTKYCKRLGKIMFKELHAQDNREPEYV